VPVKPTRRLPRKFSRRASPQTKRFVERRMQRKSKVKRERLKRATRRLQANMRDIRTSVVRWGLVILLVLLVTGFGLLLFSPIVQVREIHVKRLSPRLDIESVQQTLAPMFGKHLFFISSFEIIALLQENISDIKEINISKSYPSTLQVEIELDPLSARVYIADPEWLGGDIGTGATLDYLTEKGVYVHTASAQNAEALPMIILVDWGARPQEGTVLLQPALLKRMDAAEIALLRQFGQEVSRRVVYLRAQEFHLHFGKIELWFDLKSTLDDQFQRYRTFLKAVNIADVKEYVDLRLTDRVVHK